jgi:hypothetical protein
VHSKQKSDKCMVVGDSMLRNVGAEHADMVVECFPGIRTDQLHPVTDKRDLGSPQTVIIHVGINDLTATKNLDFVTGKYMHWWLRQRVNSRTADLF